VSSPLRVGFLGAGLIATFHSKVLRASGVEVERVGVWDPDRGRAEGFVAAAGGFVADGEDQVLDGCDAVYVCTWTSEHPRLVSAAVARGLAVFCEKPLAVDLATATRLADEVVAAGVTNQVGLVLRRSPAFNLVRALIADEAAGPVMAAVFRDDQFIPIQGHYGSTWRGDVAKAGAGTFLEHSIHDVDLVEHLLGPVTSVSARSAHVHDLPGIEDSVSALLELASGATVTLTSVWHDVLARPSLRRLEVLCRDRWIAVEDDWTGPVTWQDPTGEPTTLSGAELLAECERRGIATPNPDGDFVTAAAAGAPAWPDVTVALRAHRLVDAVYRSAASGGSPVATVLG